MKNKNSHPTIIKSLTAKDKPRQVSSKPSFRDAYAEYFMHREMPAPKKFLERIALEMIEYVETTDEILRLDWFFTKRRIFPHTARQWCEANPEFKEIYQACKAVIGMRREDKGLRGEFREGLVEKTMPMYDDEYAKLLQWKSKLAKDAAEGGTKIVIIDRFAESKE